MARRLFLLLLLLPGWLYSAFIPHQRLEQAARLEPQADTAPPDPPLIARFGGTTLRHEGGVGSPVFRPDSKVVAASAGGCPDVREWDVATARELRRYVDEKKPGGMISVLGYPSDMSRLVTRVDLSRFVVYDTATGGVKCRVEYGGPVVVGAGYRTAAGSARDGRLTLWSLEDGSVLRTFNSDPIYDIAMSWDEHWLAAGYYSPTLVQGSPTESIEYKGVAWVWPTRGGPRVTLTLPGDSHSNGVGVLWVHPSRVLAWTRRHMALFDAATGDRLAVASTLPADKSHWKVWWQEERLFTQDIGSNTPTELDPATLKPIEGRPPPKPEDHFAPTVSPDGTTIAEGIGCSIRLTDARTRKSLHPDADQLPTAPVTKFRFSRDGKRMLTPDYPQSAIWDAEKGVILRRIGEKGSAIDAYLSPDGRWAAGTDYYSREGQAFVVWDANTGAEVYREGFRGYPPRSRSTLGTDAKGNVWVYSDEEFIQYEVPSGRVLQTVKGFQQTVYTLLSPDGSRLTSVGGLGFEVRSTEPGAQWQKVENYTPTYRGGCEKCQPQCGHPWAFSHDGRRLLAGCGWMNDQLAWKVRTWRVDGTPKAGEWRDFGGYPAFTPDGRFIVAMALEPPRKSEGMAVSPETTLIIPEWPTAKRLRVSDPDTGAELFQIPLGSFISAFAFTPDGKRLLVSHYDTTISVWDWEKLLREKLKR